MSKLSLGVERAARQADALIPLESAAQMLAAASTPAQAGDLYDIAAAARRYAKSLEARNYATEVQLRAGRKGGQMLIEMAEKAERHPGGRLDNGALPKLDDLGITPMRSSRWQSLARKSPAAFEAYIAKAKANGEALSLRDAERTTDGVFSSDTPEWYTPKHVVDAVDAAMLGIDLDPCAEPDRRVPATSHYTEADDGLAQPWHGRVYMNPPYGRTIGAWVDKLADEYESGRVLEAVALVPARTDTAWWAHLPASTVCFITGRLSFSDADPAPFPSAACYMGPNDRRFAEVFLGLGLVYVRLETDAAA